TTVVVYENPVRRTRNVRSEPTMKMGVADQSFIQPRTCEVAVLQLGDGIVVVVIACIRKGSLVPKISNVRLVTVADAELHRRFIVDLIAQFSKEQCFPERPYKTAVVLVQVDGIKGSKA